MPTLATRLDRLARLRAMTDALAQRDGRRDLRRLRPPLVARDATGRPRHGPQRDRPRPCPSARLDAGAARADADDAAASARTASCATARRRRHRRSVELPVPAVDRPRGRGARRRQSRPRQAVRDDAALLRAAATGRRGALRRPTSWRSSPATRRVARAFVALPFDHLLFTGSTAVGREVAAAAGANLVPVTLELGGKSPAILDADCDLAEAALRLMTGKLVNTGQTCIAPDYVLAHESLMPRLVEALRVATRTLYPTIAGQPGLLEHRRRTSARTPAGAPRRCPRAGRPRRAAARRARPARAKAPAVRRARRRRRHARSRATRSSDRCCRSSRTGTSTKRSRT